MAFEQPASLERAENPFSTECFGFETENPAIRALDWLEKWRDEKHVARGVKSHLEKGVMSRKERFGGGLLGEALGRTVSGYFNEPQGVVHIHTPYDSLSKRTLSADPRENWKQFFASPDISKGDHRHTAYLLLDVPEIRLDNYKGRHYVFPDSIPAEQRKIKALFLRSETFSEETRRVILEECRSRELPIFEIETLEKI